MAVVERMERLDLADRPWGTILERRVRIGKLARRPWSHADEAAALYRALADWEWVVTTGRPYYGRSVRHAIALISWQHPGLSLSSRGWRGAIQEAFGGEPKLRSVRDVIYQDLSRTEPWLEVVATAEVGRAYRIKLKYVEELPWEREAREAEETKS